MSGRQVGKFMVTLMLLLMGAVFVVGSVWILDMMKQMAPNEERVAEYFDGKERPVFYKGELQKAEAVGTGESLLLSYDIFSNVIDPDIYLDEDGKTVTVTTKNKLLRFKTDQLTAMMNDRPVELNFPLQEIKGELYLPVDPLKDLYGMVIREDVNTGAVLLWKENDVIQWGEVQPKGERGGLNMRTGPSVKDPIVTSLPAGDQVMILSEQNGWYEVQQPDGYHGFAFKSGIAWVETEVIPEVERESPFIPWKPLGQKINLTWEAVYNVPPDPQAIGPMPGVNVVSPTWFELQKLEDGTFSVANKADPAYVSWAHERGYQVWGLFSNSFDPDWTREMLTDPEQRMHIIRQLISFAEMYQLQGINIDFENVYFEDQDRFTQFVREMSPMLHEQGLVVSIDVTIRGGSAQWSLFLDRERLAEFVDYMIVMTYDEHWASSPVAGSVASLPWVEKGMVDIMEQDHVPASKLIVGVPLYTRIWTEKETDDGVTVTSRAVSMNAVQSIIEERDLEPVFSEETGQHYVEYVNDEGHTEKIWIEDETSMKSRVALVNKYDFAGIASWQRGFANSSIWNVIDQELRSGLK